MTYQPKGSMCASCQHSERDGTQAVKCAEFHRKQGDEA